MTQPETYRYTDPTDAFGHTLTVVPVDASTYDGTIPVVSLGIQVPAEATDPENPIVYVPLADVDAVVAGIYTAAGRTPPRLDPIQECDTCHAGYDLGQPCQTGEFNARMAAEQTARGL